jgi:hypothetical protein
MLQSYRAHAIRGGMENNSADTGAETKTICRPTKEKVSTEYSSPAMYSSAK